MKIWYGYGSEHSMNLVMIGHFKNEADAQKIKDLMETLAQELDGKIELGSRSNRFSEPVMEVLKRLDIFTLSAAELEQFLNDVSVQQQGDSIILTTEEDDISAFLKLMIHNGAKVEVYSAHDYPETSYGRGK